MHFFGADWNYRIEIFSPLAHTVTRITIIYNCVNLRYEKKLCHIVVRLILISEHISAV